MTLLPRTISHRNTHVGIISVSSSYHISQICESRFHISHDDRIVCSHQNKIINKHSYHNQIERPLCNNNDLKGHWSLTLALLTSFPIIVLL